MSTNNIPVADDDENFEDVDEPVLPAVQRYRTAKARAIRPAVKKRIPWRQRTRKSRQPMTEAEKQANAARRKAEKDTVTDVVKDAMFEIHGIIVRVHEEIGTHDVPWWTEYFMQLARKVKKGRSVSKWNAYQSLRVEQLNEGMFSQRFGFQL